MRPSMRAVGALVRADLARRRAVLRNVPVEHLAEGKGGEDRGVQQGPDHDGECVRVDHVARGRHLRDEVGELRAAHHGPTDDELRVAHKWRAEHLREDARADAHQRALPERFEGEQLAHRDGERHGGREEDPDHPRCRPLRLLHPNMVRMVVPAQARERHAGDEAAPQVRAQEVRGRGIHEQEAYHDQEEQHLVPARDLRVRLGHARQDPFVDRPRPELDRGDLRRAHGDAIWEERLAKGEHQQRACNQRQDCAEDRDGASLWANMRRLLEVEVHAAFEDHEGDAGVANERKEARRQLAFVRDHVLAFLDQAFIDGGIGAAAGGEAPMLAALGRAVLGHDVRHVRHGAVRLVALRMLPGVPGAVRLAVLHVLAMCSGLDVVIRLGAQPHVVHSPEAFVDDVIVAQAVQQVRGRGAAHVTDMLALGVLRRHDAEDAGAEDYTTGDLEHDGGHTGELRDLGAHPCRAEEAGDAEQSDETAGSSHGSR
eukprot:CAMPEP_0170337938 /NCGR_PEP_ID=MMETSP0116_2-20130129/70015_1 /TAXON_ID=400756 /ORGANISM="Durinskia baltica, Strain CSIRO CS-38" /LENGTH=484 /DNA_ID=CAMNT_0010591333 /DNA_START=29 /DNA_END=1484 /DNA_ORIENTATION=-